MIMFEVKSFSFEIKASEGLKDGEFEGYGAAFNNLDSTGDIIMPGAFKDTLTEFLKTGVIAWQHSWRDPIGKPMECHEDEKGLFLKGKISETTRGKDALTLLRDKVVQKMSIGYRTLDSEWFDSLDKLAAFASAHGMRLKLEDLEGVFGGVRVLKSIKLYEVSLVTVPANDQADITAVKNFYDLIDGDGRPHAGLPFASHLETVLAAVTEVINRAKSIQEIREKEGRVLSDATRGRLKNLRGVCDSAKGSLGDVVTDIDSLLAETDVSSARANTDDSTEKADDAVIASILAQHETIKNRMQQASRG
jgi:HK97 family phage prohead protease